MSGFVAPTVIDRPINGVTFLAYIEQQLVLTLRPDDVVIMDNLAAHKVAGVREAIEAVGAQLGDLPPYSPDLNENVRRRRHSRPRLQPTLRRLLRAE